MSDYTLRELMIITAARFIKNSDIIFCGTGISLLAAMAAKHIIAPNSVIFFETGAIDSNPEELPLAVADPRVMFRSSVNGCLADAFAAMQNKFIGKRIAGIVGAAQIDRFGNLNSTVIGDYWNPRVRLPGSGGACDLASFVNKIIIFMRHEKNKFVKKLDYLSSPGWLNGGETRRNAGLTVGGPAAVITNMGVMDFDGESKKMRLQGFYPGVSPRRILDNMEFSANIEKAVEISPPTVKELDILRRICDPQKLIL